MAPKYELPLAPAIAVLLLLSTQPSSADEQPADPHIMPRTYTISWRYGFDYQNWTRDKPFHVHDILLFVYGEVGADKQLKYPEHPVDQLRDKSALDGCQFGFLKSRRLGVVKAGQNVRIPLSQLKPYYVASGRGDDCRQGSMKLAIWVEQTHPPARGLPWVPQLPTGLALLLIPLASYLVVRSTGCLRGVRTAVIKKTQ